MAAVVVLLSLFKSSVSSRAAGANERPHTNPLAFQHHVSLLCGACVRLRLDTHEVYDMLASDPSQRFTLITFDLSLPRPHCARVSAARTLACERVHSNSYGNW